MFLLLPLGLIKPAPTTTATTTMTMTMTINKIATMALLAASTATALEDIPPLGLGTWLSDRDQVPHAVEFGLTHGYAHIDAAWIYRGLSPNTTSHVPVLQADRLTD